MATNHLWPSTCTDTQLSIVAEAPRRRLRPAVPFAQCRGDGAERAGVEDGTFTPHVLRFNLQDTVQLGFAGTTFPVPGARSDVHVVVRPAGVAVVVPAGQHQTQQ